MRQWPRSADNCGGNSEAMQFTLRSVKQSYNGVLFTQGPKQFAQVGHRHGRHFHRTSEGKSLPELVRAALTATIRERGKFCGVVLFLQP